MDSEPKLSTSSDQSRYFLAIAIAVASAVSLEAFASFSGTHNALDIGLGTCATVLLIAALWQLRIHNVFYSDSVLPACLVLAGTVGAALTLMEGPLGTLIILLLVVMDFVLLVAYRRMEPKDEENARVEVNRNLLAKPAAYLFAYGAVYGMIVGIYSGCDGVATYEMPVELALFTGVFIGGLGVVLVRSRVRPTRGIDTLTRVSLIIAIVFLMCPLLPNASLLGGLAAGVTYSIFGFLFIRMSVDLSRAFSLGKWFLLVALVVLLFSVLIGWLVGALVTAYDVLKGNEAILATVCIVAVVAVTVYGLSPDRVWTASELVKPAEGARLGTWKEACKKVAVRHSLTPRETEVFELLAKGRNAAHIEEELVISNHTVRSHMLNIYRKLDIHSQQELIDMVEQEKSSTNEDE